ncbi:HAD family hydrolase [Helicobacter cinaedi]|uniref:HAD family hydrolase n=1 Tax=Helicobacter cinaedi TaxID=213 RepID=UPI000CF10A35|nr:HAD family hydrolase [Helicobacter cinaedi]
MEKEYIVLFDLDGTLIDSTQAIYASFSQAYLAMNDTPPSLEQVKSGIGHTLESMFLQNGVKKQNVDEYVKHYRVAYRRLMEQGTHLLPNAKEAIILAHSFATLGVVTTKRGDFSQILLDKLGVWEYFSGIVGIESVSNPKPHAEPILKVLEMLDKGGEIQKDRIYMIGDTILDIQAAKNAKIQAVGVLCGFGKKEALEKSQAPLCENTLEAVEWIKQKALF